MYIFIYLILFRFLILLDNKFLYFDKSNNLNHDPTNIVFVLVTFYPIFFHLHICQNQLL